VTARRAWAVIVAGVLFGLVSGAALGVVWWRLAPRMPVLIRPGAGGYPEGFQPEETLASDITFGLLAIVAGVAITIGLAHMRREHLVSVLVAGLAASAVGTAAMWLVGTRLGSVDITGLVATTTEDVVVDAPLQVSMPAMYLLWSISSAAVVVVLALGDWLAQRHAVRRASGAGDRGE